MKTLNVCYPVIYWTLKVYNGFIFLCSLQMCGYFIPCYAAIFLHDAFNCCNGLCCRYSVCPTRWRRVCYRTNAVHELPSQLVHSLKWQTCITTLNFHSSMNFDGFHPFTPPPKADDRTLFFFGACCKRGPPSLHYYCAVVLHSCIVLPPVDLSSNYECHYCQLTRQWSCVSNFYRTSNIFIWLSHVCTISTNIKLSIFCLQIYYMFLKFLRITSDIPPSTCCTCWSLLWIRCFIRSIEWNFMCCFGGNFLTLQT